MKGLTPYIFILLLGASYREPKVHQDKVSNDTPNILFTPPNHKKQNEIIAKFTSIREYGQKIIDNKIQPENDNIVSMTIEHAKEQTEISSFSFKQVSKLAV